MKELERAHAMTLAHFRPHSDGKYNDRMMTGKASQILQQQEADADFIDQCEIFSDFEKAETLDDTKTWIALNDEQAERN